MNIRKKAEKLMEYANLEGSEIGEACRLLCDLAGYTDYIGDDLAEHLEKEIEFQLLHFQVNSKIVEKTVKHSYKELEWN